MQIMQEATEEWNDICMKMIKLEHTAIMREDANLLAEGVSPAEIHAFISSAYVDIFRVKAALDAGKKPETIATDFGYPPQRAFILNNAARDGRYLTQKQISEILNEILKSDAAVKSNTKLSGNGGATALEILITKILKITAGGSK